jgi:hypothetical protein
MSRIWQRIGHRCGPNHADLVPKTPVESKDRGQFISSDLEMAWRYGRWEARYNKVLKMNMVSFYFYGPGYSDYECTKVIYPEEEFRGAE